MDTRFQLLVNNEVVCTAGLDGFGTLTALVSSTKQGLEDVPSEWKAAPEFDEDEWLRERMAVVIWGSQDQGQYQFGWSQRSLSVGDEVTIRILPPGQFDAPTRHSKPPAPMA
jgi:hypothetical protein